LLIPHPYPDTSLIHWRMLQSCRKMSKQQRGKRCSREQTRVGMSSPAGFEGVRRSEAVRVWLLGRFRVSVGARIITQVAWRLKKAAALVKLLVLAPGHRMHREQAMDALWPDSGRRAAANNLRSTPAQHPPRRPQDPRPGRGLPLLGVRG
jgi:hypothetical protein